MAENNKDHAPVAASLNLLRCPMCGGAAHLTKGYATENVWPHGDFHRVFCGACQIRQLFHRTKAEAIAAWNRRTPPAEVSADTLPPPIGQIRTDIERTNAIWIGPLPPHGTNLHTAEQMREYVAPYAEQIKKLERNQLPNLADGEDEVSFPGDGKVACTTEARYWELRAAEERVAELERELAERKQVQSIGDDLHFCDLITELHAAHEEVSGDNSKKAWNALIAYIDARPAGTAPEGYVLVPKVPPPGMIDAAHLAENCGNGDKHFVNAYRAMIAAAPSLSTGTEESK